ncbi:type I-F CRISPR-associated helicase Cas3f [Salinisphaera hydrothermalis]|uniref:CRISPR-associated helicase Cas3 family n=1 Tax=Salinisphaera hydrothermalis (strain C41B8) TaxID=1304275 RepID=A0A084ILD6_SALHC|nr:type I-F CRISPR-associated helicase Cas3f [Salinisphaera hydrothermalis]KEZ77520.1 CRISPR-associated helicase Cas3 family [Salinisphaera hydrothermalis C41B8]
MNVLFVSQCNKNALKETRRILDQFAERRGDRTWQTPITKAGLDTLRKMLRKSARKNTAVACHWIRGANHSELLWVVGNAARFNDRGATPTHTTQRDVLRAEDENNWHSGEDITLLAMMAGLLHDLGKATIAFKQRLDGRLTERNRFRHEWVSLRLFLAFVGDDDDEAWLTRLLDAETHDLAAWTRTPAFQRDGWDASDPCPFRGLPPLAKALAWLIVSHHRLPVAPVTDDHGQQVRLGARAKSFNPDWLDAPLDALAHTWNERLSPGEEKEIAPYWQLAGRLPVASQAWRKKAARLARRLLELKRKRRDEWHDNPFVLHLARLSLMLADHYYSSLGLDDSDRPVPARRAFVQRACKLTANTTRNRAGRIVANQSLDEHLLGVTHHAGQIAHVLPTLERDLARIGRHRGLRKRSGKGKFQWQDTAFDTAVGLRERAARHGAFIVNMASTGCGKTLANARLLYALADPQQGLRATFALGLRALTQQTGRSYRKDLHLSDNELAIRVGGSASRALFAYYERLAEETGSASVQHLIAEDDHVLFEGTDDQRSLLAWTRHDPKTKSLLAAPMLVCTVDHLVPATESLRGGRQIAPMLRLMSSDLVLDELDDYDLDDLPALTRLVQWAGMLGTRVVLSSATLPPDLVEGMFLAYQAGRREYQRNRGADGPHAALADIPCLWVDEFGVQHRDCGQPAKFAAAHADFVQRRVAKLEQSPALRLGKLWPLDIARAQKREQTRAAFAQQVRQAALQLHHDHAKLVPGSHKRVSFGLLRMANIDPLFDVAKTLFELGAPEDTQLHLCVYHARFPLVQRAAIEQKLDTALNRRDENAVFQSPDICNALEQSPATHHLFIVLASPVCEVGRDWDADWAIAEPSSMRALIQLAGRVQRHRRQPNGRPNILIFDTNLRHFDGHSGPDGKPAAIFIRPGFEQPRVAASHPFRLVAHRLGKLMRADEYQAIDALPRIAAPPAAERQAKTRLVDLEHARMADTMQPVLAEHTCRLNAASGWQYPQSLLTGVLAQQQPFRENTMRTAQLVLLPDDDESDTLCLHRVEADPSRRGKSLYVRVEDSQRHHVALELGPRVAPWGQFDLDALLAAQAEEQDLTLHEAACRFGQLEAPENAQGWRYHPWLGFSAWRG